MPQAVFLLIGKTSALTMNIAGVIKDWMLIFFSFYLFHAPVTALNLAGYAFCCSGALPGSTHVQLADEAVRVRRACVSLVSCNPYGALTARFGLQGWRSTITRSCK